MRVRMSSPRLEVRPYRLPLSQPLRTAHGVRKIREGFIVFAHEDGRVGRGDAAPIPELGTESLAECLAQLESGADRNALPATPAARCALEQALLDLESQRKGVPLARLLDAGALLDVPASALLASSAVPDLAREAQRAAADGFGTLKLKVGLEDDYARAAVVRDAAGPNLRLRLDANGAWDASTALRKLRDLSPLGIEMCEQPTPDLRGLEGAPVPIAADEMVAADPEGALLRARILVLKPMLLGGLVRAWELARRAHQRGLQIVVTSSLESAVGRAGAAHLAAAVLALGAQPAAGIATGRLVAEEIEADPFQPRSGIVHIPAVAGLGLP